MKSPREFLSTPTGQLLLVGLLAALVGGAVMLRPGRPTPALPKAGTDAVTPLLRTFVRPSAPPPAAEPPTVAVKVEPTRSPVPEAAIPPRPVLPLSLLAITVPEARTQMAMAPYGRLIPCETVLTLESSRLDTPVIGLVTEDVWHDGELIVPAGAEVHGRASPDRARERLAAQGAWTIVWRKPGDETGAELKVQGLALDRERDPATGAWGRHDGSAGLRGEVLRTNDSQAMQLFAAAFLSNATTALQDTRTTAGVLGETVTPAATARNAGLAGTSAVLREYAGQIREAIERDGIYVRVPAGKPFYLYVTERIERNRPDHAR